MNAPVGSQRPGSADGSGLVDSYDMSDLEALVVLHRYRDWILDRFQPYLVGNVVEIGAGIGSYSEEMLKTVATLDLVEPSANLFARLQERFTGEPRARLVPATAEAWAAATPAAAFDGAVMINVLEHIEDDERMLAELHRIIRPGGHLLLFVPALMLLYSRLDKMIGHFRRYHLGEIRRKVETAGFSIRDSRYFDLLGTAPWLVVNRLLGATRISPGAASLYDTVGVPVTRTIERWIPPPFGKNVILVAQRPHA